MMTGVGEGRGKKQQTEACSLGSKQPLLVSHYLSCTVLSCCNTAQFKVLLHMKLRETTSTPLHCIIL